MSPEHPPAPPGLRPLPPLDRHLKESTVADALARAAAAAKLPNAGAAPPVAPPATATTPTTPTIAAPLATATSSASAVASPAVAPAPRTVSSSAVSVVTTAMLPPTGNLVLTPGPRQYGIPDPPAGGSEPAASVVVVNAGLDSPTEKIRSMEIERRGRHAAPEVTGAPRSRRPIPRLVIFAGALFAAVVLAVLLLVPALSGDPAEQNRSQQPSPVAATPTAASASPIPSASPTPSIAGASPATGRYYPPRTSPRTESTEDSGSYDDDSGSYDDSDTEDDSGTYDDDSDTEDHGDDSSRHDNSGWGSGWWSWFISWLS